MYYNHACAAKGEQAAKGRQFGMRSMQRASVNIYKTDNSYEMLVFAPGRVKENFKIDVVGTQLTVSYTPSDNFPRPEWILREYSRGGFSRIFNLDDTVDTTAITAKYENGVLEVSLPKIPGKEAKQQEIKIS